jgi:tRNA(Glu) U13 pseudouridine synthase TruD
LSLRLAAALKLSFASLGFAGTKDKKAVTYQWVSIADRTPAQLCSGDTRSIASGRP